jgi:hypothetical protein
MVVCDGGYKLLGVGLGPLGGFQFLDELLGVLKLALKAPDHGVQGVVPAVPAGAKLLWPQLVMRHQHTSSHLLGGFS